MPWMTPNHYRFDDASIRQNAPPGSGVYGLYSTHWVYVGESDNLQQSLLAHLAGDNPCVTRAGPRGFLFERCPAATRMARRNTLVAECGPDCNERLPVPP